MSRFIGKIKSSMACMDYTLTPARLYLEAFDRLHVTRGTVGHDHLNDAPDGSAGWYSLHLHGTEHRLSDNFTLVEFASRDGEDIVLVHPALVHGLEKIREHFGKAVHVNSGFRTRSHNRSIGGATNSRHCLGLAADIDIRGVEPVEVADLAESMGFGGVGRYNTFTHVDVSGRNRRWQG